MQLSRSLRHVLTIILCLMMVAMVQPAAAESEPTSLPEITLDVLEGYVWSSRELSAAPGQTIIITNRDVSRHTFTIDTWDVDLSLVSLEPVTFTVPEDAAVGSVVEYYSSIPGDREGGLVGQLTVVTPEAIIAGELFSTDLQPAAPKERVHIEARDNFTFEPALVTVGPGTIIEIENVGVIAHHFVVDEWNVNQTIAPGETALVLVPADVRAGSAIDFYCSVPGHEQQGMVGVMRIVGGAASIANVVQTGDGRTVARIDMRPFVPEAEQLGEGWTKLRSGSSESMLGDTELNSAVFPYSGIGAVYLGPGGARVTLVVLPLQSGSIPSSQISDAIRTVEDTMAATWSVDLIASAGWRSFAPPDGCTATDRLAGIVPTITLPAGVTSCQLTGVGVAIFVSVEGSYNDVTGVRAADDLVQDIVLDTLPAGGDE